ncbi:hypothetical protein M8J75_005279 [Diaphorina citri]|nr:hypothetical protein M8J75_005279 [Diaphorina citri]
MLDRLKQWSVKIWKRAPLPPTSDMSAGPIREMNPNDFQLQKPLRLIFNKNTMSITSLHCKKEPECCANCKELIASISECGVCLEPLDRGITSCQTCGNLVCASCAARLLKCPFCRITIDYSWQRNVALERIFTKLELPCRNFRFGCKVYLPKAKRDKHEDKCKFRQLKCPMHACPWTNSVLHLSEHLNQVHHLHLLKGNGVNIEISNFKTKVSESETKVHKYVILMNCYSQYFICKLCLYKKVLTMSFVQISNSSPFHFGVFVNIASNFKSMKGIVPIHYACPELHISCDALVTPWKSQDNCVKIYLNIRYMNAPIRFM